MFVPVTEWVLKHPTLPLVYAFTSFWSDAKAVVTTFRVLDKESGKLQKLGRVETGGYQAASAEFCPFSNGEVMTVAHHNDGTLSFFDVSKAQTLDAPIKFRQVPQLVPGTRTKKFPSCLPSLHHVRYGQSNRSSNNKYLLACDVSKQGRVWTYAVDERGLPLQSEKPTSSFKPTFVSQNQTLVASALKTVLGMPDYRIRRAIVHPNGKYVYLLYEMNNVLQVYEIDSNGKIICDCLQELPTIDPAFSYSKRYFGSGSKWTGVALNSAAELYVTEKEVMVSNRAMKTRFGRGENSIRIFRMEEDGARLVPKQTLETAGPEG
ncbi:MAG: hypothetical protein SGARI_006835 [Bacillariaceae sp.]